MSDALKVSRRGNVRPLMTGESVSGEVDGDDIDWTTSPVDVGTTIPDYTYLLASGAEQHVIMSHGSMGSTETFDPADGNVHTGTLTADCTVTITAPAGSGGALWEWWLTQDGTGGWDITWPGSVTEEGTHDTTAGTTQRVILESIDGGTSWIATWIGGGSAAAIDILDEGVSLTATPTSIDFVGAGVTASAVGDAVTVTIPAGGTSALDAYIWRPLMDGSGNVITDGTGQAVMAYSAA